MMSEVDAVVKNYIDILWQKGRAAIPNTTVRSPKKKIEFLLRVYHAFLDRVDLTINTELTGIKIKCQESCVYCCKQLITASQLEAMAISSYLEANQEASSCFRRQYEPWDLAFEPYRQAWFNNFNPLRGEGAIDVAGIFKHRCPFLTSSDLCSIYPVRPIICRTWVKKWLSIPCRYRPLKGRYVFPSFWKIHKLMYELDAYFFLQFEIPENKKPHAVTPLPHQVKLMPDPLMTIRYIQEKAKQ